MLYRTAPVGDAGCQRSLDRQSDGTRTLQALFHWHHCHFFGSGFLARLFSEGGSLRRWFILRTAFFIDHYQERTLVRYRHCCLYCDNRLVGTTILLKGRIMKKTTLAIVALVALGGAGLGAATLVSSGSTENQAAAPLELQSASFAVENMTCATCPITVKRAMEGVAGVNEVTIDFETKTAVARFDPSQTTADAIAAASTNAGYPAERNDEGHL